MGVRMPRALAGLGIAALAVCALAAGCGSAPQVAALQVAAAGASPGPASPSLGKLTIGSFPATPDGADAQVVCEQWAGLRAEYVARVGADTPYQLEQWFSGPAWAAAFTAGKPLRTDPAYSLINAAFGLATTGAVASIADAKLLDQACAEAH